MFASRRGSCGVLIELWLATVLLSGFAAAQGPDQVVAQRVLGPQWKQLSRRAGMIFAGTVLPVARQTVKTQAANNDRAIPPGTRELQLSFRVDEAITGVERGQISPFMNGSGRNPCSDRWSAGSTF